MLNKEDTFWSTNDESDEDFESMIGLNKQNQASNLKVEYLEETNNNIPKKEESIEDSYVEVTNDLNKSLPEKENEKNNNEQRFEFSSDSATDKMNIIWSDDEGDFPLILENNVEQVEVEGFLQNMVLDKYNDISNVKYNNDNENLEFENNKNLKFSIENEKFKECFYKQNDDGLDFEKKKFDEEIVYEENVYNKTKDIFLSENNKKNCDENKDVYNLSFKLHGDNVENSNFQKNDQEILSTKFEDIHFVNNNENKEEITSANVILNKNLNEDQLCDISSIETIKKDTNKIDQNLSESNENNYNKIDKNVECNYNKMNTNLENSIEVPNTDNFEKMKKKYLTNNYIPLVCNLGKFIFINSYTKQKRISRSGNQTEVNVNFCKSYKLNSSDIVKNHKFKPRNEIENKILNLINLKEYNIDTICEILEVKDVIYSDSNYEENICIKDINIALNLKNISKELALDYCLKKNMNIFYILFGGDNKLILQNIVSDSMKCLYNGSNFIEEWSKYFKHVLYDNSIVYKYINFYKNDKEYILLLTALHLLNIVDMGNFIHNLYLFAYYIEILLLVHNKKKIHNIDLLIYEYLKFIKINDYNFSKEFYKEHRKILRCEIQKELDEYYNMNWNFGIKNVLSFGINKILIDDDENKKDIKNNEKSNNNNNKFKEEKYLNTDTKNTDNYPKLEEKAGIEKTNNLKNYKKTEEKFLYKNEEHSKSFVDTFNIPTHSSEYKTEDDTSLFLSKYNVDIDSDNIKKENENSSIFNIFSIFKKKSYKIDLDSSEDIKYDPITKKWVSNNMPTVNLQSVKKTIELPKPSIEMKKKENIKNLYAGKKSIGSKFSTFKKNSK